MKNRKRTFSRQNQPKILKRRNETFRDQPTPPTPRTATTVTGPIPNNRDPPQPPKEVWYHHPQPRPRRRRRLRRGPHQGQDQRPLVRQPILPSPTRPRRARRRSTRSPRTSTPTPPARTRQLLKRRIQLIRPDSEN